MAGDQEICIVSGVRIFLVVIGLEDLKQMTRRSIFSGLVTRTYVSDDHMI